MKRLVLIGVKRPGQPPVIQRDDLHWLGRAK